MHTITQEKFNRLKRVSSDKGIISALAIDQRGSLKKMIEDGGKAQDVQGAVEEFKVAVSELLTPYASAILLDPEYGLPATHSRDKDAGLLLAYEKTGYDATKAGRLPDLLPTWSVERIKDQGADAVKILLYYDVDEGSEINEIKKAFIERIGSECLGEDMPFFMEIVTYDANITDSKGAEYAKVKPYKVNQAVKEFTKDRYHIDVLKLEVPVNMAYVEGFAQGEVVYSREEAARYFKEQDEATDLPYIYLSGGVTADLFQKSLSFAHQAGARFNGVLCGRATWKGAIHAFVEGGDQAAREWLEGEGKDNIQNLNKVLEATATPWSEKVKVK